MVTFQCEGCGQTVDVAEAEGDREHACPQCGTAATAPVSLGYSPPVQKSSNGLAIAALVLGVCGFIPRLGFLPGTLGIVFASVVLTTKRPGRGMAAGGLAAGIVSVALCTVSTVSNARTSLNSLGKFARQMPGASACGMRLSAIGSAMQMYTSDQGALFPATLQDLIDEGYLDESEAVECPWASLSGDGEYFYLPPAAGTVGSVIVACDLEDNHEGIGRGVLLSDGNARWLQEAEFQEMLALSPNAAFAKALAKALAEAEAEGP